MGGWVFLGNPLLSWCSCLTWYVCLHTSCLCIPSSSIYQGNSGIFMQSLGRSSWQEVWLQHEGCGASHGQRLEPRVSYASSASLGQVALLVLCHVLSSPIHACHHPLSEPRGPAPASPRHRGARRRRPRRTQSAAGPAVAPAT